MATIVSETNLVTKDECSLAQANMAKEFQLIKEILNKLPKQILDEANDIYVRKDVYDINIRSMVEEMRRISNNTENLQKNDDVAQKSDNEKMFRLIQMAVNIIVILGMAYIATK